MIRSCFSHSSRGLLIKFASYRSQTSFKKLPSFHKMSEFKESNDQLSPDFKSNEIHVKIDEVGRTVSLTFELVGEFHTMNRGYDEILEKTLHRFSITCRTKLAKTSNKAARASKKQPKSDRDAANTHAIPEPVLLMHEGGVCDASSTLNYQMKTGMTVTLDSMVYTIVVNPPTVTSLGAYPKYTPYVGCPIVPQIAIEFGDEFSCMWAVETASNCTEKAFTIVSTEKVFVPSAAHEGCRVKLFCCAQCSHTGRQGRAVVFYLAGAIQPGFSSIGAFNRMIAVRESFCAVGRASPRRNAPTFFKALLNGACSSQEEEKECAQELRGDDELRVVTYNILAEPFATSEQAYVTLYPYCDQALLQSEFRIQRVLAEIVACDADVLCLQECDLRTFEGYLLPLLGRLGYAGHFTCKGSTEGCAVFTYEGTCHVAARIDLPLKNVLREASYLENLYLQRPDLRDVLGGKLGTVAQLTVVQCVHRPDRALVIANTHLFYHPLASFLRAIQAYAITQALSAIKEAIEHPRSSGLSQDFISLVRGEETNQIMQDKQRRIEKTLFPGGWVEGVEQQRGEEEVLCGQAPLKASVIFCGDLNSSPNIAAMQFLVNGFATEEQLNHVWEELKYFYWGDRESNFNFTSIHEARRLRLEQGQGEHAHKHHHNHHRSPQKHNNDHDATEKQGNTEHSLEHQQTKSLDQTVHATESAGLQPVMQHSLQLMSAAGFPEFSNYTPSFQQLLDYILVPSTDFTVARVAYCPGHEVLGEFTALPSVVIPSDHISIAVDLLFKD